MIHFRFENGRVSGFGRSNGLDIAHTKYFEPFRRFLKESVTTDKSLVIFYKKQKAKIRHFLEMGVSFYLKIVYVMNVYKDVF